MPPKKPEKDPLIDAQAVLEYLHAHPNFLLKHPELIDILMPPAKHEGDRVVDLHNFMVKKLQSDNVKLRGTNQELVDSSRENLNGSQRVHSAVISLLSAISFEDLLHIITSDLVMHLGIDAVTLCIEADDPTYPANALNGIQLLEPYYIEDVMGARHILVRHEIPGDPQIFGGAAGLVRSDALIKLYLGDEAPDGILALGARDPEAFHPTFGTETLAFLGQVVEICIRKWLDVEIL